MTGGDVANAQDLANRIEPPDGFWVLPSGPQTNPVTFKQGDVPRGPEGQPLALVHLPSGRTAFVNPNTNQYYLTDQTAFPANGTIKTWKLNLPPDAQFSNSHFSDADVRYIQRLARPAPDPWLPPLPLQDGRLGA